MSQQVPRTLLFCIMKKGKEKYHIWEYCPTLTNRLNNRNKDRKGELNIQTPEVAAFFPSYENVDFFYSSFEKPQLSCLSSRNPTAPTTI